MKHIVSTSIFFLVLTARTVSAQGAGDSVFAGTQIHTINLRFSQAGYWDSLTTYYAQNQEQNLAATLIVNGVRYDSVGVRLKGNAAYGHPNNKKPIRITLDHYRSAQRWNGLKAVHLNNCWGDPTFMREKVHLDFCRDAGINAPRANFARVLINDTLFALYSLVEHVDKEFLNTRYGNDTGDLFKAVDGFGGTQQFFSDFRWLGADTSLYLTSYELKTEGSLSGWRKLVRLLDTLNNNANTNSSLPRVANLNTLYRAIAADNLFANLDSYLNSSRNFYFYFHPVSLKMEWIVWDAGLSFGSYTGGVTSLETMSVSYVSSATSRPLLGKIFTTSGLRNEYLSAYCLLFNGYYSPARLFPKIDSIAGLIRPYVTEDPRKMYTVTQFETNINVDINAAGGGGTRKPGLKSFITARQASVQSQLTGLGVTCLLPASRGEVVINEFMAQNDSIRDPAGQFDDWIELYNNASRTINLGGMYLTDDFSRTTKWQFPANTTITPGGYVIVWADEDSGQAGLHANFRLDAAGEQLRFGNVDASVLDSINFGVQAANRTTARVPNGTGGFFSGRRNTFSAHNGNSLSVGDADVPLRFLLEQNYPNPFNPTTQIRFGVRGSRFVSLKVFDLLGREVATLVNDERPAGEYGVEFDASGLSSGVYYYRLTAGSVVETKKMILIR